MLQAHILPARQESARRRASTTQPACLPRRARKQGGRPGHAESGTFYPGRIAKARSEELSGVGYTGSGAYGRWDEDEGYLSGLGAGGDE